MRTDRLRLVRYEPGRRNDWNALVRASKNGTFLFDRGFMEYHTDRFDDVSLMAVDGERDVVAILPAAYDVVDGQRWLSSHPGLTYGGWVSDRRMTTAAMLKIFDLLRAWVRDEGFAGVRYKAMPRCYHSLPAEEDLYALFVNDARLVRQDVGSVIDLPNAPAWGKGKRQSLAKAQAAGVTVAETDDLPAFVTLLTEVLAAHGAEPVHTVDELRRLRSAFPESIRLYAAHLGGAAIAYVLVFDTGRTVHTQYMASGSEGRATGGLEAIIDHLQSHVFAGRAYLSFGISTEQGGRVLNEGLIGQKEMFGGRPMVSPVYELSPAAAGPSPGTLPTGA